ncbi:uncharacterized protein [Montipora capricornis]|uniref:uncharacterized protein n=1 Tax=Montipora capricornis TaxID=246305 RepID=UPI0035F16542
MQCEGTFKEFYDLLTEKYEKHKEKPQHLERALRKVIKRGKEMLQELQRQDRKKTEEQERPKDCQERSDIVENKGEESDTPSLDKNLEEELKACKRDLEAKEREIESLTRRVAHYSDMRTKRDQRHVEDTLSLNRQSRVEQDFKAFTSDERIDTSIMIQNVYKEKTDINAKRLTSMMFEVVYEYVLSTKISMTDALKGISKFAVDNGPYIPYLYSKQNVQRTNEPPHIIVPLSLRGSEYPRDVLDGLLLAIKESAPEINTDIFLAGVKHEILRAAQQLPTERSCKLNPSLKLLHLDDYLRACIKLTWRMVTQFPPLRLEYHTFTYKRECHKIVESQDDALDGRYQEHKVYYLWPGLVDGGGRTIIKGEVALEK